MTPEESDALAPGFYLLTLRDGQTAFWSVDGAGPGCSWRSVVSARLLFPFDANADPRPPLDVQLARAVLLGDEDAVWPLIDALLELRNRPQPDEWTDFRKKIVALDPAIVSHAEVVSALELARWLKAKHIPPPATVFIPENRRLTFYWESSVLNRFLVIDAPGKGRWRMLQRPPAWGVRDVAIEWSATHFRQTEDVA